MIKTWLRTRPGRWKEYRLQEPWNAEDDPKLFRGDGFVENYQDAIAAVDHPDPEIHDIY